MFWVIFSWDGICSLTVGGRFWAAAAKSLQSWPTLCDTMDGSPPGSPVPGILQARTLEWVAISFSKAWKWKVKLKSLSRVRPSATPWITAYQAPLSMGFSRQEYWSGNLMLVHIICFHTYSRSHIVVALSSFSCMQKILINFPLIFSLLQTFSNFPCYGFLNTPII